MKTMAFALWKWLLVAGLMAAVGVLMLVARKRGSRLYRLRISMYAMLLAMVGGGSLVISSCDSGGGSDKDSQTVSEDAGVGTDGNALPDEQMMCYAPRLDIGPETPNQPDVESDPGVTCYEPVMDIGPTDVKVDYGQPMCYDSVPDVKPSDTKDAGYLNDMGPTCYAPLPPDVTMGDVPGTDTDVMVLCYEALPPDVKPETAGDVVQQPDVPGPTCYAPPLPDDTHP
jgi:hypothetical protein